MLFQSETLVAAVKMKINRFLRDTLNWTLGLVTSTRLPHPTPVDTLPQIYLDFHVDGFPVPAKQSLFQHDAKAV